MTKLVGFNRGDPDQVLLLKEQSVGGISVGLLFVSTGKIVVLPYDMTSSRDHQMIEHLEDWQRSYGDKTVYVNREPKHEMSGWSRDPTSS